MLRRFLLCLGVALFLVSAGPGCQTKEPVVWSTAHNERKALTVIDGFYRSLIIDPERIFFDMEEYPNQTFPDHMRRIGQSFAHGFHRFHMDFDRIILDMEEYPLETEY